MFIFVQNKSVMRLKNNLLLIFFVLLLTKVGAQTPNLVLCKGGTINYSEYNTGSSLPSVAWSWTFQGATPSSSTDRNPQNITYPNAGLFKTTCISTFNNGAKDTGEIYVLIIDGAFTNIPMNDTMFCGNNINLTLDASNKQIFNRFVWSSPDVTLQAKDTFSALNVTKTGTYKVTITNICGSTSKTVVVKQGVMPSVNLGGDQFVCRNIAITLDAGFTAGYSYSWIPTLETTAQITASMAGNYKVTVTSADGCKASDDINLIDSCPPVVWLPNAFTPNDAAPNDIFKPYIEGFKKMNMRIYNRWGEKMFETSDLNGGWDGFYMKTQAIDGIYICILELIGNDSYRKIIQQNFQLMR
jgi:gliding motility-associated-like protein